MDALFLDPRNVSNAAIGTKHSCQSCSTELLFEEGFTYLTTLVEENRPHYRAVWFCCLNCLLSSVKGGNA